MAAPRSGRAISHRQLAAVTFLLAVILFGAINIIWSREVAEPRVVLLGSGDALSALVTSGHARVLIATGNDPSAAANALGRVRYPTLPRLDVLVLAGDGSNLAVPASFAGDPDTRLELALSSTAGSDDSAALQGIQLVSTPRRLALPDGMTITMEGASGVDLPAGGATPWRMIVERGTSRVVLLSSGADAGAFPPAGAPNVLVVSGADPLDAWGEYPAPVLAFNDAALSPDELRSSVETDADGPDWAVRIFPGEAVAFRFANGAVEIDSGAAVRLVPAPEPAGTPQTP